MLFRAECGWGFGEEIKSFCKVVASRPSKSCCVGESRCERILAITLKLAGFATSPWGRSYGRHEPSEGVLSWHYGMLLGSHNDHKCKDYSCLLESSDPTSFNRERLEHVRKALSGRLLVSIVLLRYDIPPRLSHLFGLEFNPLLRVCQ